MKKLLVLLILFFSVLNASSFDDIVRKAKESNKLVLVELKMEFCPYCVRMEKSVLSKPDIKKIIEEKYVFIKLDIKNDEIPEHLTSRLTPTFYFLSQEGEIIEVIKGLTKKSDFKFFLEEVYKQEILDK